MFHGASTDTKEAGCEVASVSDFLRTNYKTQPFKRTYLRQHFVLPCDFVFRLSRFLPLRNAKHEMPCLADLGAGVRARAAAAEIQQKTVCLTAS